MMHPLSELADVTTLRQKLPHVDQSTNPGCADAWYHYGFND